MPIREKLPVKNIKKREKKEELAQKKSAKQQKQPPQAAKKRAAVVKRKEPSSVDEEDDDFQKTPAVVVVKRPPPSKKVKQQQIQSVNSESDSDDDDDESDAEEEIDSIDDAEETDSEEDDDVEEEDEPAPPKKAKKAAVVEQPKGKNNAATKTNKLTSLAKSNGPAFASLGEGLISDITLGAIAKMGFTAMTEILSKSLPPLLQGRDLVATAQTGSDKTLAFLVPSVELIYKLRILPRNGTGVIIISPTCELAMQTFGALTELMPDGEHTKGLVMDGSNRKVEHEKLGKGINILVATPGRLLEHLQNSPDFLYKNLRCLVIDEVDRILEKGYEEELKQIISLLPKRRQTMLFSASQTDKVDALSKLALTEEPIYVSVSDTTATATLEGLQQWLIECSSEKRLHVLLSFLKKNRTRKIMVFFSSCMSVKFHHDLFNNIDLPVTAIHGKQKQLKRTNTFAEFCNASEGILLCTDVAASGLDISQVDWIVQYDAPDDPKEYIQRIARVACGKGSAGHALLLLRPEEAGFITYLKAAKVRVEKYPLKKTADIQLELEKLISRNYFLSQAAKEAFKSYMRAYDSHQLTQIFDVNTLDWNAVAKSFGLLVPQVVDLKLGAKRHRPEKRVGGGGFGYFKQMNKDVTKERKFKQISRMQLHKNSKITR